MKQILILLLVATLSIFAADEPAFEAVFNGKDFRGWKVPATNPWWTIADGVLTGQNDEKMKGNTLETEKAYQDCVIEAQVRWTGEIDSGIFVRKGQKWQCQIGVSRSLKKDMTCSIYAGGKYPIHANAEKFIKVGEWNAFKIEAKGDHYRIWLNGEKVVDADLPGYNEPGPIGLQIHAGL